VGTGFRTWLTVLSIEEGSIVMELKATFPGSQYYPDATAFAAYVADGSLEIDMRNDVYFRNQPQVGSHGRWKTPLPSNSPHDHMILRVELVGSHGRWKTPLPSNSPHDHMILREWSWWAHTGGGNALAFKQPT
jgi:hypothetical protein